jgi:ABC-2 type transport system permease protein
VSLALYQANFRFYRLSALVWAGGAAAYAFFVAVLYQSVGGADYAELIEGLPEALRAAMGLDPDISLTVGGKLSPENWVAIEFLGYGALLMAIYGVVYGAGAIAREAENGTLDLVLSQPVRRREFVFAKAQVFITSSVLLVMATALGLIVGLAAAGASVDVGNLSLTLLQAWLIGLAIGGVALAASCALLSTGRAGAVAGLLTVALYFLEILSRTVDGAEWVGNVSFFHFYQAQRLMTSGDLSWTGVIVCSTIAVAAVAVGAAIFERRDIPAR